MISPPPSASNSSVHYLMTTLGPSRAQQLFRYRILREEREREKKKIAVGLPIRGRESREKALVNTMQWGGSRTFMNGAILIRRRGWNFFSAVVQTITVRLLT